MPLCISNLLEIWDLFHHQRAYGVDGKQRFSHRSTTFNSILLLLRLRLHHPLDKMPFGCVLERESVCYRERKDMVVGRGPVRGTESDTGVLTIKDDPSLSSIIFTASKI